LPDMLRQALRLRNNRSGVVSLEALANHPAYGYRSRPALQALIRAANEGGGDDNITAVIVEVV
jgi:hypothetical protein